MDFSHRRQEYTGLKSMHHHDGRSSTSPATMLSNNHTSSIAQRRQQHRRQQSLEVPILAQPLPANPRHRNSLHHGHRRGLSLEHPSSGPSPTGFRPLHNQEHQMPTQLASTATNTNLGQPYPLSDTQHYVQDTQQHFTSQPGFPAQDFQTHLQQQLQGLRKGRFSRRL